MARDRIPRDEPEPTLRAVLNAGVDEQFKRGIEQAIELIQADETRAFWLQAAADGTPISEGSQDAAEGLLPIQAVHFAGYADDLEYPQVRELAMNLIAHHLGVMVDPSTTSQDDETFLENELRKAGDRTAYRYQNAPTEMPYPQPVAMADRVDDAVELLESTELGLYWVQVVTEEGDMVALHVDTEAPGVAVEDVTTKGIEFIYGTPKGLAPQNVGQFHAQLIDQHLFVTAHTVGMSVLDCCQAAVDYALEGGFLHDFPTSLE